MQMHSKHRQTGPGSDGDESEGSEGRDDEAKELSVKNDQFDAAFELSSGDDNSSVETTLSEKQVRM